MDNGNICIYANGTLIHTIENPEYTASDVSVGLSIYTSDLETGAAPVDVTFTDIKLQKVSE